MKIKLRRSPTTRLSLVIGLALASSANLLSAPLAATTAVHTKPDAKSPAISFL